MDMRHDIQINTQRLLFSWLQKYILSLDTPSRIKEFTNTHYKKTTLSLNMTPF